MKTIPIYLEYPYQKEIETTLLEAYLEKEGVWRILLEETVFYPMGGGQPTDQGILLFPEGSQGEVYQVLNKDGEILHYVKTAYHPRPVERVIGRINWERRYKNMRVHSAGHVIDFALYLLGYSPSTLHPLKGDHGKKPYIQYAGTVEEDLRAVLEKKANELVGQKLPFSWSFETLAELEKEAIYLQPGLPTNKPLRALRLEGIGAVADGGTIVANTEEVGSITIVSIQSQESVTTIRYEIQT